MSVWMQEFNWRSLSRFKKGTISVLYVPTMYYWEYLILPTYSSLQSVAYTQVAYRRLPIDSSLLLLLEIFWPTPSMPEARL